MLKLYVRAQTALARFRRNMIERQEGLTAVEYGVLAAFIVAVLAITYRALGPRLSSWIQGSVDTIIGD